MEDMILDNLGKIGFTVDKAYTKYLEKEYVCIPFSQINVFEDKNRNKTSLITPESNIRGVQIKKWVYNKKEPIGDCLKNVLSTFSDGDHTIAFVVSRTSNKTEMYFIVKNEGPARNEDSKSNQELLADSIKGNFQGTLVDDNKSIKILLSELNLEKFKSVSVLINNPSEYSKDYISQGLDKLLDGIVPKNVDDNYTIVFLAESLDNESIRDILSGYEDLATSLVPFHTYQYNKSTTETKTHGETSTISTSESTTNSITKTHSVNFGHNKGSFSSLNFGRNIGPYNIGVGGGESTGNSIGYGYSWSKTKAITYGTSNAESKTESVSLGGSEGTTYTYKSYLIENLIERLEAIMKQVKESQANGLWRFSTYVLANNSKTSKNVAYLLRGITQGKESHFEPSAIQEWSKGNDAFDDIVTYLNHFTHPRFMADDHSMVVTPTSYVGTDKLSNVMVFPRKSLQGLPVIEGVAFGREPHGYDTLDENLSLGVSYHMYEEYKNKQIKLSIKDMASHTFITGSTGSGKSFTVYKLLSELISHNAKNKDGTDTADKIHFLVIEPAKGEYKNEFGKYADMVYGTNPKHTALLRLNPFSFNNNTHILEHLDRLIEIFNACWPMYAAMPAVLKQAIEKSYEDCGWNLSQSENQFSEDLYPSFSDVIRNIRSIIDTSDYDDENKGAYKGSLITRLLSLTDGLNGQIFTEDEVSPEYLFERNIIVDLSRVSSPETKSLIMGIILLKLHEHRMNQPASGLKHVTVLEEAHNLLRRTSTEQSQESSNLMGKSVEMLTNSIAEMRAFGEGFIIADQSPGLLDMAVIRNTNTKIILRLPEQSDRELVGRAANLSEEQISELARLKCGVAAVYQNEWIEPVLCKVDEFKDIGVYTNTDYKPKVKKPLSVDQKLSIAKLLFNGTVLPKDLDRDLKDYKISARSLAIIAQVQKDSSKVPEFTITGYVITELFKDTAKVLRRVISTTPDKQTWTDEVNQHIMSITHIQNDEQLRKDIDQAIITEVLLNELHRKDDFNNWFKGGYLK